MKKPVSLKYEPAWEPFHISVKKLFLNAAPRPDLDGVFRTSGSWGVLPRESDHIEPSGEGFKL